jgi:hypothetical protein
MSDGNQSLTDSVIWYPAPPSGILKLSTGSGKHKNRYYRNYKPLVATNIFHGLEINPVRDFYLVICIPWKTWFENYYGFDLTDLKWNGHLALNQLLLNNLGLLTISSINSPKIQNFQ